MKNLSKILLFGVVAMSIVSPAFGQRKSFGGGGGRQMGAGAMHQSHSNSSFGSGSGRTMGSGRPPAISTPPPSSPPAMGSGRPPVTNTPPPASAPMGSGRPAMGSSTPMGSGRPAIGSTPPATGSFGGASKPMGTGTVGSQPMRSTVGSQPMRSAPRYSFSAGSRPPATVHFVGSSYYDWGGHHIWWYPGGWYSYSPGGVLHLGVSTMPGYQTAYDANYDTAPVNTTTTTTTTTNNPDGSQTTTTTQTQRSGGGMSAGAILAISVIAIVFLLWAFGAFKPRRGSI